MATPLDEQDLPPTQGRKSGPAPPPRAAYKHSYDAATACPINNSCLPRRAAPQNPPSAPSSKIRNADADRGSWACGCGNGNVMQFTGPNEGLNACIHCLHVYHSMEYTIRLGLSDNGPQFRDYNYSINRLHRDKQSARETDIYRN